MLSDGESCVTYGNPSVLFYRPKPPTSPTPTQQSSPAQRYAPSIHNILNHNPHPLQTTPQPQPQLQLQLQRPPPTEISLRLQLDSTGTFSAPFNLSTFQDSMTSNEFFIWFESQTRHQTSNKRGMLTFHLQNAIPAPRKLHFTRFVDDDLDRIRRSINISYETTKRALTGLKEFSVLVTTPSWPR